MKYKVKPLVCDYAVIYMETGKIVCVCNIKSNAELIADILNGDAENSCAYSYDIYPYAKYKVKKADIKDVKIVNIK